MTKLKTNDMVLCGIFASIIAILAQISIPLPFTTVPMTMLIFAVGLTGVILGCKKGFISICIYILLGAIGIPVFAGMRGGFSVLAGPTGGFLLGCPFMVLIIGYISERYFSYFHILISMILGLTVVYFIGTTMFSIITKSTIYQSLLACVIPFVFVDFLKLILATSVGVSVSKRINLRLINN